MGCNCGKPKRVIYQPTPEPIKTPDELHSQQLNEWYSKLQNNGDNNNTDQEAVGGLEIPDGQQD